ncbi:phage tail assembly protein [Nevskia sp.]|uniref:phage tail assembly protein n=1 Tax=Nevskia sp. TaxID=1929292 RepID=UPI003F700F5A
MNPTTATRIPLVHPIQHGDKTITELVIRRPKARDYRLIKKLDNPFDMVLDMAAALTDLPAAVIDDLDGVDDLPKLMQVVTGFLDGFPEIGRTS